MDSQEQQCKLKNLIKCSKRVVKKLIKLLNSKLMMKSWLKELKVEEFIKVLEELITLNLTLQK